MDVLAVIPARLHASRFPGKPLAPLAGRPLVARVAERVRASGLAARVLVSTDDPRVAAAARAAGVEAVIDPAPHASGSDRVAAAARAAPEPVVLDVQGDEPLIPPEALAAALAALADGEIGTAAAPLGPGELEDPDVVKVRYRRGRAIDFTRAPEGGAPAPRAHVGVYAFRRDALARFAALPPSPRERRERLEQLRAVEAGITIGVRPIAARVPSVNRPADIARVEAVMRGA